MCGILKRAQPRPTSLPSSRGKLDSRHECCRGTEYSVGRAKKESFRTTGNRFPKDSITSIKRENNENKFVHFPVIFRLFSGHFSVIFPFLLVIQSSGKRFAKTRTFR